MKFKYLLVNGIRQPRSHLFIPFIPFYPDDSTFPFPSIYGIFLPSSLLSAVPFQNPITRERIWRGFKAISPHKID